MEFNLADLFESVADAVPDAVAVVAGDRRLTYRALDQRANRLANRLAAAGIGPGDFVGLHLANGSEYIESMLACFKLRAVPVNVNWRYVSAELRHLYGDAGLVGLIVQRRFGEAAQAALDAMAEARVVLDVDDGTATRPIGDDYEAALAGSSDERSFDRRSADDLYCVYTGGTTGMPKGVLWRHEDIFFAAMGGGDPMQFGNVIVEPGELAERVLSPGLAALPVPPLMHASAQWLAFHTLFGGGKLVLLSGGRFDAAATWRLVADEGVNILVVVGDAMARPLLDHLDELDAAGDGLDTSTLMALGSGGAILSPATKRRLRDRFADLVVVDAFGASETGQLGGKPPEGDPFGAPTLMVDDRTAVFDQRLRPVEPGSGVVGRLARGGRVPLRYHGDAAKSAAAFVEVDGVRWSLPGDEATVAEDGTIEVLGRSAQCINTGGEKVYAEEVEAALLGHPDVEDVVVVGVPDEQWGQRVVAVATAREGRGLGLDDLRRHGRATLASYKLPRELVAVEKIERQPSGKPDYRWALAAARVS
ncbi:MAG: AMP-binding protein [Microthrixaceae bacterium]